MKKIIYLTLLLCSFQLSAQTVKWAKGFGSAQNDVGTRVTYDASGNSYITGWFNGSISFGSTTLNSHGSNDIFIAKLDTGGTPLWAIREGGAGDDRGYGIALDASGNIFITGQYSGTDSFGTGGNQVILTSTGSTEIFVARYNSSASLNWVKSAGSTQADRSLSIAIDDNGDAYICGYFGQANFGNAANAKFGNITVNGVGRGDLFVSKIDSSGSWKWAKGTGSSNGLDAANDLAFDNSYNLYVVGYYRDSINLGKGYIVSNGNNDFFIAELDKNGNVNNNFTGGGRNSDLGNGITIGADGKIYIGGTFNQPAGGGPGGGNSSMTLGSYTLTPVGNADGFVASFSASNLSVSWATSFGGNQADNVQKVKASSDGSIFVCGSFSTSMTISGNTLTSAGNSDAFVLGYDTSTTLLWALGMGGTLNDDCRDINATSTGVQYAIGSYNGLSFNGSGSSGNTGTFGTKTLTANDSNDVFVVYFGACQGLSSKLTSSGPTDFCQGDSVTLTASSGASTYQWNLNGSPISGETNQSITIKTAGKYDITMSSTAGCTMNSNPVTVNIGTVPSASINAPSTSLCTGDSIFLSANTGTGYTYKWYYNNTAMTGSYVTSNYIYAKQAGDYQVEINNYGCKTMSSSVTLTSIQAPTISIKSTGATSFCFGDSVLLTSDTNSTWTYQWQRNTIDISGANTDQMYAKLGGSYRMIVNTPNGCTVASNNINVIVPNGGNLPMIFQSNSNPPYCYGDSVQITTVNSQNPFTWYYNNSVINGATNRRYMAKQTGTYRAEVTINGCLSKTADTLITFLNSSAGMSPSGNAGICPNDTLQLTASGDQGSTFQWVMNGNNIAGATSNTYDALTTGNYQVVVSLNQCTYTSPVTKVTQYAAPATPSIVINVNNLACSVTASSYQWYLNGSPLANSNSQFIYGWQSGFYAVEITDANGCKAKSALVSFTNNGISEILKESIQIMPNPSNGLFNINLNASAQSNIQIVDLSGKIMMSEIINLSNGNAQLNLCNYPEGMYFVTIRAEGKTWIQKLQLIK